MVGHDVSGARRRGTAAPAPRRAPARTSRAWRLDGAAPSSTSPTRLQTALVYVAVLIPLAAAFVWFAFFVRGTMHTSGDEPHYLAFAQGMWLYHTIDQRPVLYHHDFRAYYPYYMSSHAVLRHGHLYSLHYIGLPLVILPGFAAAGVLGARVTCIVIALLVCAMTLRLAARVAGLGPAAAAVLLLGLSAPFVLCAGAIYPDLLSALLVLLAYDALDASEMGRGRALGLGLALAAMPWVHVKLIPIVCVYLLGAVVALWRQQRRRRREARRLVPRQPRAGQRGRGVAPVGTVALLALGLPVLSLAGLSLYSYLLYGSPSPAAPYQEPAFFTGAPLSGLLGQLFAQGNGLLGTAPFLLLALPGMVALWRRDRTTALKIFLITVPFWIATLTYREWWGGDAPPLRFLLPMLPLWSIGIAVLLAHLRTLAAASVAGIFAALTLALTAAIPVAARFGWPLQNGTGALLIALGRQWGFPLTPWLPAFQETYHGLGIWHDARLIPVWTAILLALWGALALWERRAGRLPA